MLLSRELQRGIQMGSPIPYPPTNIDVRKHLCQKHSVPKFGWYFHPAQSSRAPLKEAKSPSWRLGGCLKMAWVVPVYHKEGAPENRKGHKDGLGPQRQVPNVQRPLGALRNAPKGPGFCGAENRFLPRKATCVLGKRCRHFSQSDPGEAVTKAMDPLC